MHPYGYHYWHRRPSRFIWFIIGAATTTFWMNRDRVRSGYCHRPPIQPFAVPSGPEVSSNPQWNERERMLPLSRKAEDKVSKSAFPGAIY